MLPYRKIVVISLVILVLSFIVFVTPIKLPGMTRAQTVSQPIFQRLMPLYRSLRKLSDILFIPWTIFTNYSINTYTLTISPQKYQDLNQALPKDPFGIISLEDDNKAWVSAHFKTTDYEGPIKIRYRGNQANHWNAYKKSFLVKFPRKKLFQGMRELTLVIPTDRRYFAMSLNNYRSQKMGLLAPKESFVNLKINGSDHGVYLAFEHWSQEWIEKQPLSPNSLILGIRDKASSLPSIYTKDGISYWQSWNADLTNMPSALEPVLNLINIVEHATDEEFIKIIPLVADLEGFYGRDVISILSGVYHNAGDSTGSNNLVLLFDATEGRFKPIPYNSVLFTKKEASNINHVGEPSSLQKRIWNVPQFKAQRDKYFKDYVKNNLSNDLAFTSNLINKIKPLFYKDNAKAKNNFYFRNRIEKLEEAAKAYFNDPFNRLNDQHDLDKLPHLKRDGMQLTGSFKNLYQAIISPHQFVQQHPQFLLRKNQLFLPSGNYFSPNTIVIPADTQLTIAPRTKIWLGDKASIISYSPVIARGTINKPISFRAARSDQPWGVFAIFNTNRHSVFSHTIFQTGSQATINGSLVSGMLALHNADGTIINSRFEKAQGDDGLNTKGGLVTIKNNLFKDNSSDSLDVDFVHPYSTVTNNQFYNTGGDAIDLSWSNILINDNIVDGCSDKAISIGERSEPLIRDNILKNCDMGIAIKDQSNATIKDNRLINNRLAISLYQKKPVFGGSRVTLKNNSFINNKLKIMSDNKSHVQQD